MKYLLSVICICILFSCNEKPKADPSENQRFHNYASSVDAYLSALTELKKFNGVVLITKDGERVLHEKYLMDKEVASLQVDLHSQFDIHSVAKLMGKAAVLKLEEEGRLKRSDQVAKYVSDFPKGDQITIQMLMDNQSGLPRRFEPKISGLIEVDPDELIEKIKKVPFQYEPGTETVYSNLGFQLLFYIISKVSDKSYVQYLHDEFFEPLGMDRTGAHFHLKQNKLENLVQNHEEDDGDYEVIPNVESTGKNQARIFSTTSDLIQFIYELKKEPYLSVLKRTDGTIGWSGGGDGILTHAKYSEKGDYEITFFSNYDAIPFGDILQNIERLFNDEEIELPVAINRKAIEVPAETLSTYVAKYRMTEFNNDVFEFRLENGQLVFYQDGEASGDVNAESNTTFFGESDDEDYFEFVPNDSGSFDLIFHYKKVPIKGGRMD